MEFIHKDHLTINFDRKMSENEKQVLADKITDYILTEYSENFDKIKPLSFSIF